MKTLFKIFFCLLLSIILVLAYFLFIAKPPKQNVTFGVNFSQMQAEALKLDWKEVYLAILKDLGAKQIKILTNWDFVEGTKDAFYFNDVDWQLQQAKNYQASVVYVVGMKTGRWPECHVPSWADTISKKQQQDELLNYIKEVVVRYKNNATIVAWQAENEPLFNFGKCPWYDKDFLTKEVALIKSLDSTRPVIVSDSGEQSFWFDAANIGDTVSITMYRKVWMHIFDGVGFYVNYPLPPQFYWLKSVLIKKIFGKEVINGELQAEPWSNKFFFDTPLSEQEKSMNVDQFKSNIEYAKVTGLKEVYFWGTEWWYWLKKVENRPEIWNEAKKVF